MHTPSHLDLIVAQISQIEILRFVDSICTLALLVVESPESTTRTIIEIIVAASAHIELLGRRDGSILVVYKITHRLIAEFKESST